MLKGWDWFQGFCLAESIGLVDGPVFAGESWVCLRDGTRLEGLCLAESTGAC